MATYEPDRDGSPWTRRTRRWIVVVVMAIIVIVNLEVGRDVFVDCDCRFG
jgi:hypothetical protein